MKFLMSIFAVCLMFALVAGQQFFPARAPRHFNYNPLGSSANQAAVVRDPRQNRGPVVFPPSPPDAIDESSGVVVGASGYGFVPPQQSQTYYTAELPATSYTAFNYYSSPYIHRYSFF